MSIKYTRVHRLLEIISLVQSQRGWNAKTLSERCDTTERNIYRDINQIKEAGIPIEHHKETGYKINGTFFMPPVRLTFEEALAISALCEAMADKGAIPFVRPASMAMNKILAQLPFDAREELTERMRTMELRTTATMDEEGYEDVYDKVQTALLKRTVLRCKYESTSNPENDEAFMFHPYALFFGTRAWYVVGFHEKRDDMRTLKLSRFLAIEPTTEKYEIPTTFNVDKHLGNAWNMIPGDQDYEVELNFETPFSQTVSDTRWHNTQEIKWHDDDSCTFTCTVSGLEEIVWWVLSMGPYCKVVKPELLAQRVEQLASDTAAMYGTATV
ncbi:MAG: WYL domain-containing protein [Phycisphaerales bacterium]|nr:WYL domain-containing protein [Planctomycetota bacterium]MBL6997763.1 WYL domain-containing protein [Phycisphaerales bacterium]